jgi:hypothetical protein
LLRNSSGQKDTQRLSDDLLGFVAEDGFDGWVDEMDFALRIHQQHSIGRGFPKKAIAQFAFEKFLPRFATFAAIRGFAQFTLDRRARAD